MAFSKPNYELWDHVVWFTVRQAAFLWMDIEPTSDFMPEPVSNLYEQFLEETWRGIYRQGEEIGEAGFFSFAACGDREPSDGDLRVSRGWLLEKFNKRFFNWARYHAHEAPEPLCPMFLLDSIDRKSRACGTESKAAQEPSQDKFKVASEATYLSVVKALLSVILKDTDDGDKRLCQMESQNALILHVNERHSSLSPGLSDGNLRKIFAAANKTES